MDWLGKREIVVGFATDLRTIILQEPLRRHALELVASLALPDCWIGAGFVRDTIWDHLHGRSVAMPTGDVDIVWFDRAHNNSAHDRAIEKVLQARTPTIEWSVKNQARMHLRNGDAPYESVGDAMRFWPETATAIAVRLSGNDLEINAPLGLNDLFQLRLRPTPCFASVKRGIFEQRVADKGWLSRYPRVRIAETSADQNLKTVPR
ncbi:nucleotidyltransferase family protein [Sphingobium sp. B2]|uniref:nucleotidyltransferase family protein n=1 Tax=Sphingobium sp. B2 TaxID=2583228 RepID=UPI0011A4DD2B|nr:nucleotidyltransferase family protein [Sphingobium sp. B2]